MDAAVVDDVRLDDLPSVGLLDARDRIAEQVIAHMPKVQRFVGIRGRVLDHHQLVTIGLLTVVGVGINRL